MKNINGLLMATALVLFISCKKNSLSLPSQPPGGNTVGGSTKPSKIVADAGPDQTFTFPAPSVLLNGSNSHDTSGRAIKFSWTPLPGQISRMANMLASIATVELYSPGKYDFVLKVWNDSGQAFDTTTVIVKMPDSCIVTRTETTAELRLLTTLPGQGFATDVAVAEKKLIVPEHGDGFIDIYDIQNNSWTRAQMSEKREGFATVSADGKIFIAGGIKYDSNYIYTPTNALEIYNIGTQSWSKVQLSEARGFIQTAVLGSKIFFAGGLKANGTMSTTVDIYDLQTNTWATAQLQTARAVHNTLTVDNKILFLGGYTAYENVTGFGDILTTPTNAIDVFDAGTGQWTVNTMQSTKGDFSAAVQGSKVYIAGGEYGEPYWFQSFDVEVIDVNTFSRTHMCLSQPTIYTSRSAANINGSLIFIGNGAARNKFDIYKPSTGAWSVGLLPVSILNDANVAAVDNEVYVVERNSVYKLIL